MTTPRTGHPELTAVVKYDYPELRLSMVRASARETAIRVAVGAVRRGLLGELGVELGGYILRIGSIAVPTVVDADFPTENEYRARFATAEPNDVHCYPNETAARLEATIADTIRRRDPLGGVVECVTFAEPPGLGSHIHGDRRLSSRLGRVVLSIHAVKGVEFGDGFAGCARAVTLAQNDYMLAGETIIQRTNHAGGTEGGISTGVPIVVRTSFKFIATTLMPLRSVDLGRGKAALTKYELSDFCQVPRGIDCRDDGGHGTRPCAARKARWGLTGRSQGATVTAAVVAARRPTYGWNAVAVWL